MSSADPEPEVSFADLGLSEPVLRALTDVGYEHPSPIQAATIPPLMGGRDVVGLAQTGTGKTAAFALPILSRIELNQTAPQALVLAPTRELALQVAEAIGKYAHHVTNLHVVPIYGGQSYGVQLAALRRGAHVVVGTPGRVIDHLRRGTLDLSHLRFLVLDEADEMLRMGFQEDVETILAETPDSKQVALFSATMPPPIRRISKQYLHDPIEITVKNKTVTAAKTRQRFVEVSGGAKLDALTRILEVEDFESMIIFVRTKQATEDLAERLRSRGFSAAAINGDLVQTQRERTIGQLRSGELDILVATDVAARGLDVERISHVVNYDIPHDTESYVHRIGRTGRAGRSGEAVLFVTARERRLLAAIERATRQPITEMALPSIDDVNTQRVAKFAESITASLASPQLTFFRDLIRDYSANHNVAADDVAAALAVMNNEDRSFLLEAAPPRAPERERTTDRDRAPERDRGGPRVAGARRPRPEQNFATYRISVGHKHKVQPGQIMGALANEGGLQRSDFGQIEILGEHSLVELPAELASSTLDSLRATRISGQLIELARHDGPPPRRPRHRPPDAAAKGHPAKKNVKPKKPYRAG
jgi:ATP-dependent RNA helicase DeaD